MLDTGFIFIVLLSLMSVMIWAFFKFSPEFADKKTVKAFNYGILAIVFMMCVAFTFKAYVFMAGGQHAGFLPIFLFFVNMMIVSVGLAFGFLIRNFIIFRGM